MYTSGYHSILNQGFFSPQTLTRHLKEYLEANINPQDRDALETEIQCFDFYIKDGSLVPLREQRGSDGTIIFVYPDIRSFSEEHWKYIEGRIEAAQHPFLTARYAHLMWMKSKHNQYAVRAIQAYRSLAELYLATGENDDNKFCLFCKTVSCYHNLSAIMKHEAEACKKDLLSWLRTDKIPATWKGRIIKVVTDSSLFKPIDLKGLTAQILTQLNSEQYGYTQTKDLLESLLPLTHKEKYGKEDVLDLLGENELSLAIQRDNDQTGMIPAIAYQRAADYFKQAKKKEKMQAALAKYTVCKRNVKLGVVSVEDSGEVVQAWNRQLNELVAFLLSEDPLRPFFYLALNKNFLPKEISDEEAIEELQGHLNYILAVQSFDQNNNSRTLTQEKKIALHKFRSYSIGLQMGALELMKRLFSQGIKSGFIVRKSFMEYFEQSWLAMPLESISTNGEPEHFTWMDLLEPALKDLFTQLEVEELNDLSRPNYVLAIDSLAIRLEGIIRDYALLSSIPVTKVKDGETLEMNLEELLSDPDINALFAANDVLLWRMVLTRRGWNERNNVAHGFYRPKDYTQQIAFKLLICLYRISKYKVDGSQSLKTTESSK